MDELFDIVDEINQPLGLTKPRSIVHEEMGDWHRVTHIWITNGKGEILCQKRSEKKDKNPSKWQSFFGGHLTRGQSYEINAVQELLQELGLKTDARNLFALYIRKSETQKHFAQVYVLEWNGDLPELKFSDKEVEGVRWLSLEQLKSLIQRGEFCNSIDESVVRYITREK